MGECVFFFFFYPSYPENPIQIGTYRVRFEIPNENNDKIESEDLSEKEVELSKEYIHSLNISIQSGNDLCLFITDIECSRGSIIIFGKLIIDAKGFLSKIIATIVAINSVSGTIDHASETIKNCEDTIINYESFKEALPIVLDDIEKIIKEGEKTVFSSPKIEGSKILHSEVLFSDENDFSQKIKNISYE